MALFQITSLSTSSVKTILVPGTLCKCIVLSNLGAGAINFTIDGGSTWPAAGTTIGGAKYGPGTDPTTGATGLGIPLAAGATYTITTMPGDSGLNKQIRAIMQTGTTTLNVSTDDYTSTSPLN